MMAITTSSSISVKPDRREARPERKLNMVGTLSWRKRGCRIFRRSDVRRSLQFKRGKIVRATLDGGIERSLVFVGVLLVTLVGWLEGRDHLHAVVSGHGAVAFLAARQRKAA